MAEAVRAGLEERGVRCWIAPRDILPGADWGAAIVDAISASRVMVLIYSGHANASPQIKREVERAVAKGIKLVPFRIEDVPLSKNLEYFISTAHWQDALTEPLEGHVGKLAETVRFLSASRDSTQVPPPLRRHSGARLGDAPARARHETPPLVPNYNVWKRPAAGGLAAAAVLAALYFFVLRKEPPQIAAVNFPPVIVAGGRDAVGTVQFTAGHDEVAEAAFEVVSAEKFESFTLRPAAGGEKQGSFSFSIRSSVPQVVVLRTTLVDARGRRSRPVSFSFEVKKSAPAETRRAIEIPLPQGLKLKLPH